MIRQLVLTNSGNEEDVKDILQEGIITFYEKAKEPDFVLTCEVKTFLYSVCRNKWLKSLRGKSSDIPFRDVQEKIIELNNDTEENTLTLQQEILSELINTLGEACKKILTLFYYDQLSMEEIAGKMGYTNADNAKNQKYKCLRRLQKAAVEKLNAAKTLHL